MGGTTLTFLFVGFHLYTLQIQNRDFYVSRVQAQHAGANTFAAPRGSIYITDRNREQIPVAITKEYQTIYAVPAEIEDPLEVADALVLALELERDPLIEALSKTRSKFAKLVSRANEKQVATIQSLNIKGVYVKTEKARYYPLQSLAAHVIGIVGLKDTDNVFRGRYGIEAYQEDRLAGRAGRFEGNELLEPIAGEDIVTTIDRNIQTRTEEVVQGLVDAYAPAAATIIVQEPKTGKIVAIANYPTFDLNTITEADMDYLKNPAVESVYEPGSIFKVITMAAGIDSGAIRPSTTYYDSGSITLNGKTIKNWDLKANGTLSMTGVIEGSVNTGAVFAQQRTGDEQFYQYLEKFGFKEPTGIDLLGEVVGSLRPLERDAQPINFATASFGQGVSVTPIRLLSAISAIANGGVMKKPYLTTFNQSPEEQRVISKEAARQVVDMMVSAVDKAKVASIPNYEVAGKTGTAQIPTRGGYLSFAEGVIHSYAGFAPAYNPAFSILIKLDRPKNAELAGQTVVPAFRELAEFLLTYYQVPPTRVQ